MEHTKGTGETSYGMAFPDLLDQLGDSPCDLAMDWAPIPAPEPSPSQDMSPAQWYLTAYPSETVEGDDE